MHTRIPYGTSQKARVFHSWMIGQYRELTNYPDIPAYKLHAFLEKAIREKDGLSESEIDWLFSENASMCRQLSRRMI